MVSAASLARRPLGRIGLEVTALCAGCSSLGNMPETTTITETRSSQGKDH